MGKCFSLAIGAFDLIICPLHLMKQLIIYPHYIFWLSIPLLLLLGLLNPEKSIIINIHDTYFVFLFTDLIYLITMLFALIGFGYWLIRKTGRKLSVRLNLIHIVLTLGGLVLILILSQLYRDPLGAYNFNDNLTLTIYFIILVVLVGQVLFPINLIRGLIMKPENSPENQ